MQQSLQVTYSLNNIREAAGRLWEYAHKYRIFAFNGPMGAGKTTFIHTLCEMLGVTDTISSPTFALINEYHFMDSSGDQTIYHMDWYRLKDLEEAINAGMEDTLSQKDAYCFVEWPEKALPILPHPYVWLDITATNETERQMTITIHT